MVSGWVVQVVNSGEMYLVKYSSIQTRDLEEEGGILEVLVIVEKLGCRRRYAWLLPFALWDG